jgi:hypothetical protein
VGGILLVGGLYSVLWAKHKETQAVSCGQVNMTDCTHDEDEHNNIPNKCGLEGATSASAGEPEV